MSYFPSSTVNKADKTVRVRDHSPESSRHSRPFDVDLTDIAIDTHYYPSETGASLAGVKDLSITGQLSDADGTLDLSFEVINDEDKASGVWIPIYGYDIKNNTTVNTWTVTNGTLTFAIRLDNVGAFDTLRAVVEASAATNLVQLKLKAKAL